MRLLAEDDGKRTYQGADGTFHIVRAEVRGQSGTLGVEAYSYPAVREEAEKGVDARLSRWFKTTGRRLGVTPFGERAGAWTEETVEWHEGLLDQDYEPVPYFEPYTQHRYFLEQAYWPPAPVDPVPEPKTPAPKISDFRGEGRFRQGTM